MCYLDSRWNWDSLKWQVSLATPLLWVRSSVQITFLIKGTRYSSCLALSIRFHSLAWPWNYSNQGITHSQGTRTSHPLDTTKPTSYLLWSSTMFQSATSRWPCIACGVPFPEAVSRCLPSVGYPLFSHHHGTMVRSLPHS